MSTYKPSRGNSVDHSCPHSIGQTQSQGSNLTAREAWKCNLPIGSQRGNSMVNVTLYLPHLLLFVPLAPLTRQEPRGLDPNWINGSQESI